jgi:hypothetical protein
VKILTETALPPRTYRQDVPDALDQVVMRAMAKDRNQRFQTMEELAHALSPFAHIDGPPAMIASVHPPAGSETTPFSWAKDGTRSDGTATDAVATKAAVAKKPMTLAVAALAGVMLVTGAVLLTRGGEPRTPATPDAPSNSVPTPAPAPAPQPAAQLIAPVPAIAEPVVAPKPTEVQLKITATPPTARVYIGEVEFPNPTDAWRPRSLDPIRIRVEAPGHRTVEQLAIFDQDRVISFELEKGKGVKRLETLGGAKPAPAQSDKPVVEVRPQAQPAQIVTAPPRPAAPEPARPTPTDEDGVYRGPSGQIRDNF